MDFNVTTNVSLARNATGPPQDGKFVFQYLAASALLIGIIGNIFALAILYLSTRPKNSKHALMLRSLAINDLVAQIGMFIMSVPVLKHAISAHYQCVLLVLLRGVGLGSGCVAFVMALERWLALTRPFFYQQVVTHQLLSKLIYCLWVFAALVTYLPFVNVGLWYYANNGTYKCARYREAEEPKDIAYAWLFWFVGTGLCVAIVYFNTCVFMVLARLGNTQTSKLIRRVSKTMINSVKPQYSTNEELSFAKLMAFLCVIFVVCWMPDMICVVWAQIQTKDRTMSYQIFGKFANILKSVHFTLDPFVYVIYQFITKRKCKVSKRKNLPMLKKTTPPTSLSTDATTPTSVLLHQRSFPTSIQMCETTT